MREWLRFQGLARLKPDVRDIVALAGLAFLTYGGELLARGLGFLIAGAVLVFVAVRR